MFDWNSLEAGQIYMSNDGFLEVYPNLDLFGRLRAAEVSFYDVEKEKRSFWYVDTEEELIEALEQAGDFSTQDLVCDGFVRRLTGYVTLDGEDF